ncbi:tetraspanin-8-like [Zingiber officinale]|uniref:tetraspanin-8-like n=1 Tax=Zingiber officinale TaxID=94328 RepID=UPI001C4D64F7|nr:tetraspanin-8-like [Zingiber officinale]
MATEGGVGKETGEGLRMEVLLRQNRNERLIFSGCCKPPSECNFDYQSATVWNPPSTGNTSTNPDCGAWSNNQSDLCYDCQSCKAGVIANIKDKWKKIAILNIIILIFLIVVYSIGCCAFRNNRQDNGAFGWKGGYA